MNKDAEILSLVQLDDELQALDQAAPNHPIKQLIPDAPVGDGALMPAGWAMTDEGARVPALFRLKVSEQGMQRTPVAPNPIVITAWTSNHTTRKKGLELAWKARGKWRRIVADRSAVLDGSKIIAALTDSGFPVYSHNKSDMIRYIAAYIQTNINYIPARDVTEQMGWQRDGGFVYGRHGQISTGVSFVGADAGEQQAAESIAQAGEIETWGHAISKIADHPYVMAAIYGSLAAPLLEILKAPSFAIDLSYQTSSGKTTALRVAASVWGNPDERAQTSMIRSWGGTQIGIERIASIMNGLPLILDDTKRARVYAGKSTATSALYTITNGAADLRGSKAGLRMMRHWRTVLLSTGETRIVDASKDGGTAARALCLWGAPFGGTSSALGGKIELLNSALLDNYGHAGPAFVQWLVAHQSQWDAWRIQVSNLQQDIIRQAPDGDHGVVARMAGYLAVLDITSRLAHCALEFDWRLPVFVPALLSAITRGASEADRAKGALEHVVTWAATHRSRFWNIEHASDEPPLGWAGRWDDDSLAGRCEYLGVTRQILDELLTKAGYDAIAAINLWRDRGWLAQSGSSRVVKIVGDKCVRMVAIARDAVDEITGT